MGKTNQNFTMFAGEVFVQDFLHAGPFWQTQREVISVEATDGIEFRLFSLDGNGDPDTVLVKKERDSGITLRTSGYHVGNDTMVVTLSDTDTNQTVGTYGFQLHVIYGGTDKRMVSSGTIEVKELVTANPV